MAKRIDFFDGATSSSTPDFTGLNASSILLYANDAAYIAANPGSPVGGNLYYNTTLNKIRFYDDGPNVWTTITDDTQKGAANGVAPLNSSSKIDQSYLPSYVDDVEEYANLAALPVTGEAGKIYVTLNNNNIFRWTGSAYVEISPGIITSVNGETGAVSLSLDDLDSVTEAGTSARDFLRRNSGNTQWENFNIDTIANDSVTGSNQTTATVASSIVRLTNASLVSIDMVPSGTAGQKAILVNASGVSVTINNETGATPANRVLTGTGSALVLANNSNVSIMYDSTSSRWRAVGGSGSGFVSPLAIAEGGTNAVSAAGARSSLGVAQSGSNSDITALNSLSTAITIAQGGTGAITKVAGFNALSANTTKGDLVGHDGTNSVRVLVGTNGLFLRADSSTSSGLVYTSASGVLAFRSVVSTDTCTNSDDTLSLSGASFTQTLFTAIGNTGKVLTICHNGTTLTQAYTLNTTAAQTIGGVASGSYVLQTRGECLRIQSNGANWIILNSATITPFEAYTPTTTGFGTITSTNFVWRRNGDMLEVNGYFTAGVNTAVLASYTLPGGVSIDTAKYNRGNTSAASGHIVGVYAHNSGGNTGYVVTATGTNAALVYLGAINNNVSNQVPQNASLITTNSAPCSVEFKVPISGWRP